MRSSSFIAKALQDSGKGGVSFEAEVVALVPREEREGALEAGNWREVPARQRPFLLPDYEKIGEEALRFWEKSSGARPLKACLPAKAEDVAGLPIRAFPVDHSIPGACAWEVETSAGWVVFTGDLRKHGAQREDTVAFIKEVSRLRPRALLCEGTRAWEEQLLVSEEEVFERCFEVIRQAKGYLVFADFGPRNIERLKTFHPLLKKQDGD